MNFVSGTRYSALLLATTLLLACIQTQQTSRYVWTPPTDMNQTHDEFLSYMIEEGSAWIHSQRDGLRATAVALDNDHFERFAPFFEPGTLTSVRYRLVDRIENPGFYDDLAEQGIDAPLDFSQMVGITFDNTIAISRKKLRRKYLTRLLFHECVHIAQYRHLGVEAFISRYVNGWAHNGYNYFLIPLERQAYELERRFVQGEEFSVEDAVTAFADQR